VGKGETMNTEQMALIVHERMSRKEEEEKNNASKTKEDRTMSSTTVFTSYINTNLISIEMEEFTPLVAIPGILSLTS
jgi:hypothetical protein